MAPILCSLNDDTSSGTSHFKPRRLTLGTPRNTPLYLNRIFRMDKAGLQFIQTMAGEPYFILLISIWQTFYRWLAVGVVLGLFIFAIYQKFSKLQNENRALLAQCQALEERNLKNIEQMQSSLD